MKNRHNREVIQMDVPQPYYNYLKRQFANSTMAICGQTAYVLHVNAHHWLMQLAGQAVRLSPMCIVLVLCEKKLSGVLQINMVLYPHIKAVLDADYQNAFMTFYLHHKDRYRQAEIINRWLEMYSLGESINKYVKMFRRWNAKNNK